MYEKVNPAHPDKIADRIAGAIVDYAYKISPSPKVAAEVLIGHGECFVIIESNINFTLSEVESIVHRIAGSVNVKLISVNQDVHLAENQAEKIRCGDNGIFCGMPVTDEQKELSEIARLIYNKYKTDGKYILDKETNRLIICQSNAEENEIRELLKDKNYEITVNPLGYWTGGIDCDSGLTNRKLGSDMGDAVTGGGIHSKDMSKADVSINIYAHIKAQELGKPVKLYCAIGDDTVDGRPYSEIVETAKEYINSLGGFEKLAEWGLI